MRSATTSMRGRKPKRRGRARATGPALPRYRPRGRQRHPSRELAGRLEALLPIETTDSDPRSEPRQPLRLPGGVIAAGNASIRGELGVFRRLQVWLTLLMVAIGFLPAPGREVERAVLARAVGWHLDDRVLQEHRRRLAHLGEEDLRSLIELLLETRHPFTITTKSDRVLADLDLLAEMAKLRLVAVAISVTTLDPTALLLPASTLSRYTAVVVGPRAYATPYRMILRTTNTSPLATSSRSRNSCQPTSSMLAWPSAMTPASRSIRSCQRRARSLRVATLITGTAARP